MKKALLKAAPKTAPETIEKIKARFSRYLNEELEWSVEEDASLIDGTVYDCTVATKLEEIKQALYDAVGRN